MFQQVLVSPYIFMPVPGKSKTYSIFWTIKDTVEIIVVIDGPSVYLKPR
jgi:hypothetical protein